MTRFLCLLILLPICAVAQPSNTKLSERPLFESEPYIAMDPSNPQHLCAAWMSGRLVGGHAVTIVTRSSTDGGASWSAPQDMPHMAAGWQSADVSMKWTESALLISYIDYLDNSSDSGGVFVATSIDGGKSWDTPQRAIDVKATNGFIALDRPWIEANRPSGVNRYITTKPAPWHALPNHTFLTYAEHATWIKTVQIDSAPFSSAGIRAPMGSPAYTNDDQLFIAYPFFNMTSNPHAGLALWHGGVRSLILEAPATTKDSLAKAGFRLLADPVRVNHIGGGYHLALVWTDARYGDYDIFCSVTGDTDIGMNWGPPVRINDDPIGNGVMQDMVWPTYASDGTLVVVWRDRRNGNGSGYASASDTYYAYSRDGSKTFFKNFRLSDSTARYDSVLNRPGNDFMSVVATPDSLYAVWADTRTGTVQVYFAKAALGSTSWVGKQSLSSNNIALSCNPNPATASCNIEYTLDRRSHCWLSIVSEEGSVMRSTEANESIGKHSHRFSLEGLASGNYWVEARTEFGVSHTKLVINN
jgi:hypothetical protein